MTRDILALVWFAAVQTVAVVAVVLYAHRHVEAWAAYPLGFVLVMLQWFAMRYLGETTVRSRLWSERHERLP